MAQKIDAPLPSGFVLGAGWTVRVTALSPTDGSLVSGVKVSNVVINGDQGGSFEAPEPVPPLLINTAPAA